MIACPSCGTENVEGARFCVKCGTSLLTAPSPESWRQSGNLGQTDQANYPSGGYAPNVPPSSYPSYTPSQGMMYQPPGAAGRNWQDLGANKKLPAGLCGILVGALGVHKFILGYTTEGVIMLLATLLTCGFGAIVTGPISLIEGIIYLTKSDEEFVRTYVQNKRGWF